jgi:hypothetical protein
MNLNLNWNWLQLGALQLHWVHEISQTALAAAVATLGVVMLLELASISRLRRAMDSHLQRVFEQLDLLRGESQKLLEAQTPLPGAARAPQPAAATAVPAPANAAAPIYPQAPLAAGEARLLAALTAAKARINRPETAAAGN